MSFPTKIQRNECWTARDKYWECLDNNKTVKNGNEEESPPCAQLRILFEKSCNPQWVKHFDRKRNYLQFKNKIEKEGYEPLDERSPKF